MANLHPPAPHLIISRAHFTDSKLSQETRRVRPRNCGKLRGFCEIKCQSEVGTAMEEQKKRAGDWGANSEKLGGFGEKECLVREYGWKVRRMREKKREIRRVAEVQAEAFHVPSLFFNDLFFHFFQAEVLSGLLYRLRNSPPDRYACLVAEPDGDIGESPEEDVVGVVDVTVLRDEAVLHHLHGADEYLYVSGIAVPSKHRRKKVATVLLKACEMISMVWGYPYLVLRAYEDDLGARTLYSNAGYTIVSKDPPWLSWIGRKRRILMIKRSRLFDLSNNENC